MALSENQELIQALARLDSCTVANAIETFDVRLRNTGFTDASVRCMFDELPPMVGYATTARVRTSEPPMEGSNYFDRTDWWNHILTIPAPRIVVVEDTDYFARARVCRRGDERRGARFAGGACGGFSNVRGKYFCFAFLLPHFRFWPHGGSGAHESTAGRFAAWRSSRRADGSH